MPLIQVGEPGFCLVWREDISTMYSAIWTEIFYILFAKGLEETPPTGSSEGVPWTLWDFGGSLRARRFLNRLNHSQNFYRNLIEDSCKNIYFC